jgi:hypothetical protein
MFNFLIRAEAQTRVLRDLPATTTTGFDAGGIDLFYPALSNFNYFALAFSIFYSIVLYMNFWYWRLFHHRERLHHEAKGVKSIQDAWWIWARYLITLIILQMALVSAIPIARTLFIFIYLIALLMWKMREDIIVIAESLSQGFGQIGWGNDWPKKLAENLKKLRMGNLGKLSKENQIKLDGPATFFVGLYSVFMFVSIIGFTIWSFLV